MANESSNGEAPAEFKMVDPPDAAWVGPLLHELHRAMWQGHPSGAEVFRSRFGARVFPVSASDEDIRNGYELVRFVAGFLGAAQPCGSEILARLVSLLRAKGGREIQRKIALQWVEWAVSAWSDPTEQENAVTVLPSILGMADDRFYALDLTKVRVELSRWRERSPARIAAALSVSVGAFGDAEEENSRKAFLSAAKVSV